MPEEKKEIERIKIDPAEKKKIQAFIIPELHRKVKVYAGVLGFDIQEFVANSLEKTIAEIEREKPEIKKVLELSEREIEE